VTSPDHAPQLLRRPHDRARLLFQNERGRHVAHGGCRGRPTASRPRYDIGVGYGLALAEYAVDLVMGELQTTDWVVGHEHSGGGVPRFLLCPAVTPAQGQRGVRRTTEIDTRFPRGYCWKAPIQPMIHASSPTRHRLAADRPRNPGGTEPIESDAIEGAFPREKLLKMDARFTDRVTRALERGKESRGAANATMTKK